MHRAFYHSAIATACIAFTCDAIVGEGSAHTIRPEVISFTNGSVILRGLLLTPQPATAHATVVMVHGSGPATRTSFGGLEGLLVRAGIPVLVYDKRGVQESTGDWKGASLEDLATDVLAAVEFLKRRGIAKIGLWGGSQGGWIVPLVAAHSTNVDFIISVAGSGVTPAEQELFRQENQWRTAGLSEVQVAQLRSAWRHFYYYASTGHDADELDREIAELEKTKVLDDRRPQKPSELPEDALVRHLGFGFDPLPAWEQVRCPVLAIWGERDSLVPVSRSVELIQRALDRSGHTNHLFRIFPRAHHGLAMSDKRRRLPDGTWETDWATGYIQLQVDWIKQRYMRGKECRGPHGRRIERRSSGPYSASDRRHRPRLALDRFFGREREHGPKFSATGCFKPAVPLGQSEEGRGDCSGTSSAASIGEGYMAGT